MEADANGEYPYDPAETFSEDELAEAKRMRQKHCHWDEQRGRRDQCPHTPPCPSTRVCLEEMAWYFRHQREIEDL